nr:hypothetical protein CFP56_33656 [Quercus suber]
MSREGLELRPAFIPVDSKDIPITGSRTALNPDIQKFLADNQELYLGGEEDFHAERRHRLQVLGIHAIPHDKIHPISEVEFTTIRRPHGVIPIRVFYQHSAPHSGKHNAALIYFHGGGYTVGSVDEFENVSLRFTYYLLLPHLTRNRTDDDPGPPSPRCGVWRTNLRC